MAYQVTIVGSSGSGQLALTSVSLVCTIALLSACFAAPMPAKADELEDMLVRLAAASAGPSGATPASNVVNADGIRGAIVSNSANGSQGIMALNQDAGPGGATQANVVVVALSVLPDAAAVARLLARQVDTNAKPTSGTQSLAPDHLAALAIVDSYRGGSGIAQVNQSAGTGNIQRNATLIAAALGGGDAIAVSEADLSALGSATSSATPTNGQRGITSVAGSFTDFSGVVQVNQTIGTGNLVANTVSLTFGVLPTGGGL